MDDSTPSRPNPRRRRPRWLVPVTWLVCVGWVLWVGSMFIGVRVHHASAKHPLRPQDPASLGRTFSFFQIESGCISLYRTEFGDTMPNVELFQASEPPEASWFGVRWWGPWKESVYPARGDRFVGRGVGLLPGGPRMRFGAAFVGFKWEQSPLLQVPVWPFLLGAAVVAALGWRRQRIQHGPRCAKCRYPRAGLPAGATCPECGRGA